MSKDHRGLIGYAILAVSVIAALYYSQVRQDTQLRRDINHVAAQGCIKGTRPFVKKHNRFVDEIIKTRVKSAALHDQLGEKAAAKNDRDAIKRYRSTKLRLPTLAECQRPLLK